MKISNIKMTKKSIKLILLLFIGINIFGQNKSETVAKLLETTGTLTEIKQLDVILDSQIAQKKTSFENEEQFQLFSKTMKSAFNAENSEKFFVEYLLNNSSQDNLQDVILMYNNPLFKRMIEVEAASNDPKNQEEQMAYFQNMSTSPPPADRITLMMNLNNQLGASEMAVSLLQNVVFSIANGANLAQPKEKQLPSEELKSKLETSFPPNFSQQMTNQIVAFSLYTYKDISETDLNEYIKYWGTPSGKYYMKLIMGAYEYSFTKMGEKLGESLLEFEKS